jgi:threonylcarbamoyladenosine tRNA methylthiotransferase MtaB
MPHACIGVDVIVGFPGETDEHFLETYRYLNEMDISYLHVFKYSERDNTEAAEMLGLPENVRVKSKMMRGLSVKKRRSFMKASWEVLSSFESENKEGYIHGFTENYVKVKHRESELVNTLHEINLTTIDTDGVRMEFVRLRCKHFKII